MAQYLMIRNWQRFQHYKDRNPPWIKLHYELLTSPDWVMVSDASKLLAIVCMMLASRKEGRVLCDASYIQKVANLSAKPCFKQLIDVGFFDDASILLADASTKTETEAETYREETDRNNINIIPVRADKKPKRVALKKTLSPEFMELWTSWQPFEMTRGNRDIAAKEYEKAIKEATHETIIRAAAQYTANCATIRCKTKHVSSWLNKRGWESEESAIPIPATNQARHGGSSRSGGETAYQLAMADTTHRGGTGVFERILAEYHASNPSG